MWVVPIKLCIVGLFKGNWVGSDSLGMVSMAGDLHIPHGNSPVVIDGTCE